MNKLDNFLVKIGWYKFLLFIEEWIYPAYLLKNALFYKHNKIKLPQFHSYDYIEVSDKMKYANFELIKYFIEKEKPEKHICWYKDEDGVDCGHKYGENPDYNIIFPEYKDKWIMDIIKDIYHYYTVILPLQEEKIEYLKTFHYKYLMGEMKDKPVENSEFYEVYFDKSNCIKSKEELYELKLDWNILDSIGLSRQELLDEKIIMKKIRELENEKFNDIQQFLHLSIEVRPYLWT